ncbi:MAG: glycosyltransferase family 87 protein [Chloroflexota bacterium]
MNTKRAIPWYNQIKRRWFAVAAVFLAMWFLVISYTRVWPFDLDIGVSDARFVNQVDTDNAPPGFHAVEDFAGTTIRWTSGDATISLPRSTDGRAVLVKLRLLNSRPDGQPDPQMRITVDGVTHGEFSVPRAAGGRTYEILVPGGIRFDWATRIQLQSDTITLPDDPRPLGVAVDQVTLEPIGQGMVLPSLWMVVWSLALGVLAYVLPRSVGVHPALAFGIASLLSLAVAVGIAARPLEVLPFVQRIAGLLGVGMVGVWLARWLAPIQRDPQRGLIIRGAQLPIYLAIAWWMGPLFQLVMTLDEARNVTPAPATMWLGGVTLIALVAVGLWYALQQRNGAQPNPARLTHWALAIFAVVAVVHLGTMLQFAFTRSGPDFWILFKGAREWVRGGSLYDLEAVTTNHFGHVFKVPPFYGMLFTPFVFEDGLRILLFHRILNVLLLAATAILWLRMFDIRIVSVMGAGLLILLNFRPLADTIAFGQIDLALLLVLTAALWAMRRERHLFAGVLIALGTLFKIYPVILLAFFFIKRHWMGLVGFVVGMLAFNGIAIAVMGWEMHRVYLLDVVPRIGGTTAWVENQTIAGFLSRLSISPTETVMVDNQTTILIANALSVLLSVLACVLTLGRATTKTTTYALQYSQYLLLMVLVVPAAWMHYQTLLIVPFAALLLHLRDREVSFTQAALLATSFALIAYGNQWSFYDGTIMGVLTVAGVSYKFYGMLLLGGLLVKALLEVPIEVPNWRLLLQRVKSGANQPKATSS